MVFPDVDKLEKLMIDEVLISKSNSKDCRTTSLNKPQADYQTISEENEKRKRTIRTTNAILNDNPELKRQFIVAKKEYEQKHTANIDKAQAVSSQNTPKQNSKDTHSKH